MENSDGNHASQSEFCSRKRKYPDFVDSNLKVENDNVNSVISELKTDKNISVQFPSILKDKIGLITNLINPNYGLVTIGFDDTGTVSALFDTCEFWHDGSTLSQQNLVLQNVVSEGDLVKINAIKMVQIAQEDRNILYLATDIAKVENTNQDWCNLVQVNDLGDLPKEKIATFHAVTTYLKSVPLSKREKEMNQIMKCRYVVKPLSKNEEEEKGKIKIEKPFVVPKDTKYKKGNVIDNPNVVPLGLSKLCTFVSVEELISVPILAVPNDVLIESKSFDIQESRDEKSNTKQKVKMNIPKGVPKVIRDKKGNVIDNPNVVPLGLRKPKKNKKKKKGLFREIEFKKPCDIQESWLYPSDIQANMAIPKGVPKQSKDKQGNIFENPNVVSLGSKKQCTFGGKVSNTDGVSIIKWHKKEG